jgi:hypothetical protein
MTFKQYVAEIQALAEQFGAVEQGQPYCDAEAWRDAFKHGASPAEAWAEEVACMGE